MNDDFSPWDYQAPRNFARNYLDILLTYCKEKVMNINNVNTLSALRSLEDKLEYYYILNRKNNRNKILTFIEDLIELDEPSFEKNIKKFYMKSRQTKRLILKLTSKQTPKNKIQKIKNELFKTIDEFYKIQRKIISREETINSETGKKEEKWTLKFEELCEMIEKYDKK